MRSTSLNRATRNGDNKFIKLDETYRRFTGGLITKSEAVAILSEPYRNTITMWPTLKN